MKLLIVDDDVAVQKMFEEAVELWNGKHKTDPAALFDALDFVKDPVEAQKRIESPEFTHYDGVVLDLRFKDEIKGDELLSIINDRLVRIPTVVYTGTPDSVKGLCLRVCTKSEEKVDDILLWFWDVKMSGLMSVIGMHGSIEHTLQDVFCRFQSQCLTRWAELGKSQGLAIAERSVMRYILMHLLDSQYSEEGKVFPDEMYLNVDKTQFLKTGDIIVNRSENGNEYYLVMSPACDLVVRKTGTPKTESVLLVGIVLTAEAAVRKVNDKLAIWQNQHLSDDQCAQNVKNFLRDFRKQADPEYVHSIPSVKNMPGQYVAFRKVLHLPYEEVDSKFSRTGLRVAPPFMKDIQARFASYYGRQGQPDIDYTLEYKVE